MIPNWLYNEEGRCQMLRCSCCRVGDAHSTDFKRLFSILSQFIRLFLTLTPLLSPAAVVPCRAVLDNKAKQTLPVLNQPLHHRIEH